MVSYLTSLERVEPNPFSKSNCTHEWCFSELRGLDRSSGQSILDYLTLKNKLSTIFTGTELRTTKFVTYTKRIQKLNKLFISFTAIKRHHMISLQHKLVTRVTLITEEYETEQKYKCKVLADSQSLRIMPLSRSIGEVLYHAFLKHILRLSCCDASYAVVTNVRSHKLCTLFGDQSVFLDPLFFFVLCVPEPKLRHALSTPPSSVPLCGHTLSCTSGLLLFSYSATKCTRHSYSAGHTSSHPCVSGRVPKQRNIGSHQKITNG